MQSFTNYITELKLPVSLEFENLNSLEKVLKQKEPALLEIKELFPDLEDSVYEFAEKKLEKRAAQKYGVVFSGGQASGGHNVIWGLFDGLKKIHKESSLLGFLNGPSGLIDNIYKEITEELLEKYHNSGGFDLLGSGRTKIETDEQLEKTLNNVKDLKLDALFIIGGDDSNTNAAILAQYFKKHHVACTVCGVPKTIDGDLKNKYLKVSFGFDTASKLFSELVSNIERDCLSAKKYYHFIKIMGRSASHIALEVALNSHPNMVFISEEIIKEKTKLSQIVDEIADMIEIRHKMGKDYGVILIPEGLIEAIQEMNDLIKHLNQLIAEKGRDKASFHIDSKHQTLFNLIPDEIKKQLLNETDPHGNVQVSLIETEKMLIEMVKKELASREFKGKFAPLAHFLGYEGRACYPSYFDALYTYHLGLGATILAINHLSGFMVSIQNLELPYQNWKLLAIPIISLMHKEQRKGLMKPVIKKALVELDQPRMRMLEKMRASMKKEDHYKFMGPIQYFGPQEVILNPPIIIKDDYN